MNKRKMLVIVLIVMTLAMCFMFAACNAAKYTTHNLQISADNFELYRKVTVINLRSDKILLEVEGYLSLQDTAQSEIGIVIKTGAKEYKLHYVHTSNDCVYIIEQLENYTTDPYHWKIVIFAVTPNIEMG